MNRKNDFMDNKKSIEEAARDAWEASRKWCRIDERQRNEALVAKLLGDAHGVAGLPWFKWCGMSDAVNCAAATFKALRDSNHELRRLLSLAQTLETESAVAIQDVVLRWLAANDDRGSVAMGELNAVAARLRSHGAPPSNWCGACYCPNPGANTYACTEPRGHSGEHRGGGMTWSPAAQQGKQNNEWCGAAPPPVPPFSVGQYCGKPKGHDGLHLIKEIGVEFGTDLQGYCCGMWKLYHGRWSTWLTMMKWCPYCGERLVSEADAAYKLAHKLFQHGDADTRSIFDAGVAFGKEHSKAAQNKSK